ncbi:MAG: alpha/beta hydrolase [Bacteroidota bacterium]
MKIRRILLLLILVLVVVFFMGPSPKTPNYAQLEMDEVPQDVHQLSNYLNAEKEGLNIRPYNESFINWVNPDSLYKTEYAMVYLHGFSASPQEGSPVCSDMAKEFGMNYYAPLLAEHGLVEEEPLLNFTAEKWIASAMEAIEVGKTLGEKVILVSVSTGGTASLFASATNDPAIHAQILYSPNIDLYDPRSFIMELPWGLEIGRKVLGSDYYTWEPPPGAEKFWHAKYRAEALINLKALLSSTMTAQTFEQVKIPTMVAYYYRDENHHDDVVSIDAMKEMISQLGVPQEDQYIHVLPTVEAHSMTSGFMCKDIDAVKKVTREFLQAEL